MYATSPPAVGNTIFSGTLMHDGGRLSSVDFFIDVHDLAVTPLIFSTEAT